MLIQSCLQLPLLVEVLERQERDLKLRYQVEAAAVEAVATNLQVELVPQEQPVRATPEGMVAIPLNLVTESEPVAAGLVKRGKRLRQARAARAVQEKAAA